MRGTDVISIMFEPYCCVHSGNAGGLSVFCTFRLGSYADLETFRKKSLDSRSVQRILKMVMG